MFCGKNTVEPTLIGGGKGREKEGRRQNLQVLHARAMSDNIFQVIFILSYLQSSASRIVLINYCRFMIVDSYAIEAC